MLPFALKVVWFALSLSGLICCWVVLVTFARAVGCYWGPLTYCFAVTLIQGIFCLGLIWRMDPYQMPRAFCIAQTAIIGFAAFVMSGVCASFTYATTMSVLRPSYLVQSAYSTLMWRPGYLLLLLVFPVLASAAQISVLLTLDAVQPTDDLHCDASHPIWVRFLGYAGVPFIVTIPSFCMSSAAAYRVLKTHKFQQRSNRRVGDVTTSSSILQKLSFHTFSQSKGSKRQTMDRLISMAPVQSPPLPEAISEPQSPDVPYAGRALLTPDLAKQSFHLPFAPPATPSDPKSSIPHSSQGHSDREQPSPVSSSFPTFAVPSNAPSLGDGGTPLPAFPGMHRDDNLEDALTESAIAVWDEDPMPASKVDYATGKETRDDVYREESHPQINSVSFRSNRVSQEPRSLTPNLAPAIWRLILFQLAFFFIMVLAAMSTVIDVAKHRKTPTPFGTQHTALLLSGWGPLFVFGHLPGVRKRLMFWRRSSSNTR